MNDSAVAVGAALSAETPREIVVSKVFSFKDACRDREHEARSPPPPPTGKKGARRVGVDGLEEPAKTFSGLERLTKRCEMANADDAASQRKQRDMNVDAALEASPQLAECSQPGVRALDHPAMTPKPIIALDAAPGNTRPDAQLAQVGAATGKVIALVGMQLVRPASGPTATAAHHRQGIDQLLAAV